MPFIGWIRDLFGIQKDVYETKKTRLEIEKMEDEKRGGQITMVSFDDIKRYDPKIRKIEENSDIKVHGSRDRPFDFTLTPEVLTQSERRRRRRIMLWRPILTSLAILSLALLFVRKRR